MEGRPHAFLIWFWQFNDGFPPFSGPPQCSVRKDRIIVSALCHSFNCLHAFWPFPSPDLQGGANGCIHALVREFSAKKRRPTELSMQARCSFVTKLLRAATSHGDGPKGLAGRGGHGALQAACYPGGTHETVR